MVDPVADDVAAAISCHAIRNARAAKMNESWIGISCAAFVLLSSLVSVRIGHSEVTTLNFIQAFNEGGAPDVIRLARKLEQERGSDETATILSRLLTHKDVKLRAVAAHAIGNLESAGKTALLEVARPLAEYDYHFAAQLDELGPGKIPVWLARQIVKPTESASIAYRALGTLGVKDHRLVSIFTAGIDHQDFNVRWNSVVLLGDLGKTAKDAAPSLIRLLKQKPKDLKRDLRDEAAFTLGRIGAETEKTVPLLIQNLTHEVPKVRQASALGLGRMGSPAASAIPSLIDFLGDDQGLLPPAICAFSAHPQHSGATALVNIGKASVPALTDALNSGDSDVRLHAAEALGYLAEDAESALDQLLQRLQDRDPMIRREAALSLSLVAPNDKRLVPALVRMLDDTSPDVREQILWSMETIASKETLQSAVDRLSKDVNPAVRDAVLEVRERLEFDNADGNRDE